MAAKKYAIKPVEARRRRTGAESGQKQDAQADIPSYSSPNNIQDHFKHLQSTIGNQALIRLIKSGYFADYGFPAEVQTAEQVKPVIQAQSVQSPNKGRAASSPQKSAAEQLTVDKITNPQIPTIKAVDLDKGKAVDDKRKNYNAYKLDNGHIRITGSGEAKIAGIDDRGKPQQAGIVTTGIAIELWEDNGNEFTKTITTTEVNIFRNQAGDRFAAGLNTQNTYCKDIFLTSIQKAVELIIGEVPILGNFLSVASAANDIRNSIVCNVYERQTGRMRYVGGDHITSRKETQIIEYGKNNVMLQGDKVIEDYIITKVYSVDDTWKWTETKHTVGGSGKLTVFGTPNNYFMHPPNDRSKGYDWNNLYINPRMLL